MTIRAAMGIVLYVRVIVAPLYSRLCIAMVIDVDWAMAIDVGLAMAIDSD